MVKMKLVYGYIVHSYRLAAIKVKMELVYGYFIVHLQKNLLINQWYNHKLVPPSPL